MVVYMVLKIEQKQDILEIIDLLLWVEYVLVLLDVEIDLLQVEKCICGWVKKQMECSQCEYYLNEQMKVIQKEFGDIDEGYNEVEELKKCIDVVGLIKEVYIKVIVELNKFKQMLLMLVEVIVVCFYIDWLLNVLWKVESKVCYDFVKVEDIFDVDYYGLEEVKECIFEYFVV